jgi:hypothetical protein
MAGKIPASEDAGYNNQTHRLSWKPCFSFVFYTRRFGHIAAPTARRILARGNAPGIVPPIFRPEGAEDSLRPFRAHNNQLIPNPRAMPWASMHRRFQRQHPYC